MSDEPDAQLWIGESDFGDAAAEMVQRQLRRRGIDHPRVLQQMRAVPRHLFVRPDLRARAYHDVALPTVHGQTISQPYMVALMSATLDPGPSDRVLEIGTGSGYQTAILAGLAGHVYSIERDGELTDAARRTLDELGVSNVTLRTGDGSMGWPEAAPFDRILVTAGAPMVPDALDEQLADGGRLVAPVGGRQVQRLICRTRRGEAFETDSGIDCRFVPLVGEQGWGENEVM